MSPRDPRPVEEIRRCLARSTGRALQCLFEELADDDRAGVRAAIAAARAREDAADLERRRLTRLYALERTLRSQGYLVIAGVDEVGRGALAGPLSAGACVLPASPRIEGIDDSKRLSAEKRSRLAITIKEVALCWSVAHVSAAEIDALGMTAALRRAMGRALAGLELEPDHVVVDGRPVGVAQTETAVIKGDSKVAAVAAASVLAKVTRDSLMEELARQHPQYGLDVNKGYGTAEHLSAVARFGLSPAHRRSFSPGGGTRPLF